MTNSELQKQLRLRDARIKELEILITLAFLVYWTGMSIDKARGILAFFTGLQLSKSQADSLLSQLATDWQVEYDAIAELIAAAAILYIDETGWKVGKKSCYTWIFSTLSTVLYKCGVGRGKIVLTEVLGEQFDGIGVTDDYSAYHTQFTEHQLCWAHFLRKAIAGSKRVNRHSGKNLPRFNRHRLPDPIRCHDIGAI